eukprot:CAMPEP_0113593464 /NCGR_PEP_ID=MMETSP0015_2-20120614/38454_1 /TAXON_ID=2838 /ORGANISM="Odontella" /LENGTH=86 /DNA_ID=CAMNT_0000500189 /DNA_START=12 /DNA_END=269 /DNA_ORIENTATION=+ /assembly_acc=CAM_ASM_000160
MLLLTTHTSSSCLLLLYGEGLDDSGEHLPAQVSPHSCQATPYLTSEEAVHALSRNAGEIFHARYPHLQKGSCSTCPSPSPLSEQNF